MKEREKPLESKRNNRNHPEQRSFKNAFHVKINKQKSNTPVHPEITTYNKNVKDKNFDKIFGIYKNKYIEYIA